MTSQMPPAELAKLARTTRLQPSETDLHIFNLLCALDCPRALTVWLLYSNNEHHQLVELEAQPSHYGTAHAFRDAYAATLFLSKATFLNLSFDRREVAFQKFWKFEELCRSTNERFKDLSSDPLYSGANVPLLSAMIRKIDSILTPFTGEEFVDAANWGPGATTAIRGSDTSAFNKFRTECGITRDMYLLCRPWFSQAYPLWAADTTWDKNPIDGSFAFEVGNKIVTVPKNSKTDRVIAIEPGLNLWFQKGVGKMLRRRLFRAGIDLDTQKRNQQLARLGAVSGELATVDFSSASDSVAKHVVRTVIRSSAWRAILESTRSPRGTYDGRTFKWQKFSSMGNGYTFELESLIFYAAACACCWHLGLPTDDVSVFGDDVILPSPAYDLFVSFTAFLGFVVNRSKSFSSGWFRESCGSHYYGETDCKPIYLKDRLTSVVSLFKLANSVRGMGHRFRDFSGCDIRLRKSWRDIVRRVPKALRFWVSVELGDVGIHGNFDEACPSSSRNYRIRRAGRGFEGFRVTTLAQQGISLESEHSAILLCRLWGSSPNGGSAPEVRTPVWLRNYERLGWLFPADSIPLGNSYTLRNKTRLVISDRKDRKSVV